MRWLSVPGPGGDADDYAGADGEGDGLFRACVYFGGQSHFAARGADARSVASGVQLNVAHAVNPISGLS